MGKYHIRKTKKLKFARFGGLSSVNQRGYNSKMPEFHCPPASRGFYCFVWPFYEMFLLGAPKTNVPYVTGSKFKYARDGNGNIIDGKHPDYRIITEKGLDKYWTVHTKEWEEFVKKNPLPELTEETATEYHRLSNERDKKWETEFPQLSRWVLVVKPRPRIFEYDGVLWHHLGNNLNPGKILARKGDWVKTSMEDYRLVLEEEMHLAHQSMMSWCFDGKYRVLPTNKSAMRLTCKDHLECFIEKL